MYIQQGFYIEIGNLNNLLVNENGDLKIGDFGLSRTNLPQMVKSGLMTDYIATRWYRAPELLGGSKFYTEAVDMWSIGGIFAELLLREPLLPGYDSKDQLELIVNCLGQPETSECKDLNGGKIDVFAHLENQNKEGNFKELFKDGDSKARDLLEKMLLYNPKQRISIGDALNHEFIGDFHCEKDEPTTVPVSAFDFDFEMYDLSIEEQKELILDEIGLYHSKKVQKKYIKNKRKYPNGMLFLKYGPYEGMKMPYLIEDTKNKSKKKKSKKNNIIEETKDDKNINKESKIQGNELEHGKYPQEKFKEEKGIIKIIENIENIDLGK